LNEEGEMTTSEIYFILNTIHHHGTSKNQTSKNQLGNILARSPFIEKVGFNDVSSISHRRREAVWRLRD
jgi:hypothetical protein